MPLQDRAKQPWHEVPEQVPISSRFKHGRESSIGCILPVFFLFLLIFVLSDLGIFG